MTRQSRLLAFGASASALALAAHLGVAALTERAVDAALARAGGKVSHGAVALDWMSGRVSVSGIEVRGADGGRLSIGRVTLPTPYALVSPALAAGDLTVEGVTVAGGMMAVNIPRIDLKGTDATRETVLAIYANDSQTPLSARLAAISAASVSIPEMAIATDIKDGRSSAVYKNLRFDDVRNGVIRAASAAGGTAESAGPDGATAKGTYGPIAATEIDLPLIAKVYGEAAGPGDTELKTMYATVTIDGMKLEMSAKDKLVAHVSVGKMSGRDFKAKPLSQPLMTWAQSLAGRKPDDLPPEEKASSE